MIMGAVAPAVNGPAMVSPLMTHKNISGGPRFVRPDVVRPSFVSANHPVTPEDWSFVSSDISRLETVVAEAPVVDRPAVVSLLMMQVSIWNGMGSRCVESGGG